ncbi:MAG: FAD-dependent thymidylate synthase, partial [Patescibacteria group bacterium]
ADFSPLFAPDEYSTEERQRLAPFFTNLDQSVYAPLIFSPEVIGALCSRTSRAADDLRKIFLSEYITPFLEDGSEYGKALQEFIEFLHRHPIEQIFSNPRARSFYAKWLAQYGDDSIAQMAGMHIVFSSLSLVSIVYLESQRIGLAPIEKSTRYVNYSAKVNRKYRYYVDPTLKDYGLEKEYRAAADSLFDTYTSLLSPLQNYYVTRFPKEKPGVVEKKAFDTLRRILPSSTLSQVAFFGNGQAFEYLVARTLKHPLGEVRWAGERAYEELFKIAPSFLRRVKDPEGAEVAGQYQEYLAGRGQRMVPFVAKTGRGPAASLVRLLEYDRLGEEKVITGMLYAVPGNHASWKDIFARVKKMSKKQKQQVLSAYLTGRDQRWQKVGRAFENAYVRFEITTNIGAFRDLHRHRMLTEQYQLFSCEHGYEVPQDVTDAGFEDEYRGAVERMEDVYAKIARKDAYLAQYATTLAHRMRFQQWKNLRECFWEMELRSTPEGHPDYRKIEQEKFKLLEKVYPLVAEHMRVNMGDYDFARRGQEEKIQAKLKELEKMNTRV